MLSTFTLQPRICDNNTGIVFQNVVDKATTESAWPSMQLSGSQAGNMCHVLHVVHVSCTTCSTCNNTYA